MERFYGAFLASDPRVPALFARTDFARQRELFEHGIFMLLDFRRGGTLGALAIQRLGELHGPRGLRVPGDLWATWIRCFVETAAEMDPEWTGDLASAWRVALDESLAKMRRAP